MANKRTVDPTGEAASSSIVGIRMTDQQIRQIAELCDRRGIKRSQLIRDLVRHAYDSEFRPEPF